MGEVLNFKQSSMKKTILILFIVFSGITLKAQTNLDSLYGIWQDETQDDSTRVKAYHKFIGVGFMNANPDTAIILAQELLLFGEKQPYKNAKALAYSLIGSSYQEKFDYPKALNNFENSLNIYEEIGDKMGALRAYYNIGMVYNIKGADAKALEYFLSSLKISDEVGYKIGSAYVQSNIGTIYAKQEEFPKALDYFQRGLKIAKEEGAKPLNSICLNNIGNIYKEQGDNLKALDYYQSALKIDEETRDKKSSAVVLGNIGDIYLFQKEYTKSFDYNQRSLNIREEIGDKWGSIYPLTSLGKIYREQGDNLKALEYCKKAQSIGQEIGALSEEKNACQCLYDTYKAMGQGNEALVYLEKIKIIDDSLNTQETTKKLQQMEFQKEMLADSIAKAEVARLVDEAHKDEVRKKNRTRNALIGGALLLFLLAAGFYSRWRFVRKAKNIIEEEKDRSNNLLLNILPADIAEELKIYGKAEARDFDMVSILFTDFKGFTEQSAKLSAQDLVSEINTCFEAFDGIMAKYGIEKIKTIGDAYMAAGGLPVPTDDSVKKTVLAVLEMQAFIGARHKAQFESGLPAFQMRAGIHTGPVVAGIVGVKKFQYDVWGDTVNTASRMESHGAVGKVNISQITYELIKDDHEFTFEHRGKVEAKGKGEVDMYFVAIS